MLALSSVSEAQEGFATWVWRMWMACRCAEPFASMAEVPAQDGISVQLVTEKS